MPDPALAPDSAARPRPDGTGDGGAHPGANEPVVPYQSLYRRFRPQRFAEVLGQEHVTVPLHNAVRSGTVSHAYLFSGPRGTGKTSTARILAKALNCTDPVDGEPCGHCSSCQEITRGTSMDVHELDAASNNGVDAMRDLVARAALGTPGRTKVYVVDEVHMLSTAASNALLKTLEEPPSHVVFVLATTDPQKVLPTIRSRTQHFEFRLLGPDTLSGLLRAVRNAADLGLDDTAVDAAVRRGRGSARDALSVLDQVAAGGVLDDEADVLDELAAALAERDTHRALVAVGRALGAGFDPQRLAAELADQLRQAFLAVVAPEVVTVPDGDRHRVEQLADRLGLPAVVRSMERLGTAQVAMRDAPDPRAHLEVVLVRLANPDLDDSVAALVERVDRLERTLAGTATAIHGGPPGTGALVSAAPVSAAPAAAAPSPEPATVPPEPPGTSAEAGGGPGMARRTLGALRRQAGPAAADLPPSTPTPAGAPAAVASKDDRIATEGEPVAGPMAAGGVVADRPAGAGPTRDDLVQAWGDHVLASLPGRARARFRVGRFLAVETGVAVFALPNDTHRSYCEDVRGDVEEALSAHFGVRVPMRLVVDDDPGAGAGAGGPVAGVPPAAGRPAPDEPGRPDPAGVPGGGAAVGGTAGNGTAGSGSGSRVDEDALLDPEVLAAETAPAGAGLTPEQRLKQAFPGAEEA